MRSPVAVPPGWRVRTGSRPRFCIHEAKRLICVVLPEPSRPSRVMNNPRGMPRVYHPYVILRGGACGVTILLILCYKQEVLNSKSE